MVSNQQDMFARDETRDVYECTVEEVNEDGVPIAHTYTYTLEQVEDACATLLDEETLRTVRAYNKASTIKKRVGKSLDLEDGERVKVGHYVFPGKHRSGGGFSIPNWDSVGAGKVEALPVE